MLELALELQSLGHAPLVLCHDLNPGPEFLTTLRQLEVRAVHHGKMQAGRTRRAELRRLWKDMAALGKLVPEDAEVVNAHEWPALRAGHVAARRIGRPFVWTRNDEGPFERAVIPDETMIQPAKPFGRLTQGALGLSDLRDARAAAAVVVLDNRNARMVRRAYRRPAAVVRSGPAAAFFSPPERAQARRKMGVLGDTFFVLGFSILQPHRRFEDLIAAAALLSDTPNFEVRIMGSDEWNPPYADKLEGLIATLGLDGRVRLQRGSVDDEALRAAYVAADVFVFPNRKQTWGLAPLEALASGTPVIVSSDAGVHEVLSGRPGVTVVPPEEPQELAAAIRAAMRAGDRNSTSSTREWIRKQLNNRLYAQRMSELFLHCAGSDRG